MQVAIFSTVALMRQACVCLLSVCDVMYCG